MAWLSDEEVIAARKRNAVEFKLPEIDKAILVAKMSQAKANDCIAMQEKREAGKATQQEFFELMVCNACMHGDGKFFDKATAKQLLEVISVPTAASLVKQITKLMKPADEKAEGEEAEGPN